MSFDNLLELNTNQEKLEDLFNELEFKMPKKDAVKTKAEDKDLNEQKPPTDKNS